MADRKKENKNGAGAGNLKNKNGGNVNAAGELHASKKALVTVLSVIAAVVVISAIVLLSALTPHERYEFNFETLNTKGLSGWHVYNYRAEYESSKETTKISVEPGGDNNGNCLKIENFSKNDARIYRNIKVKPSSYYKITLSIKTDNVSEGAGANLSGYKMSGKAFSTTGTTEWRRASVYLETGEKQKSIDLSLGLGGYGSECTGAAYFDKLVIEKVDGIPEGNVPLKLVSTDSSSSGSKKNEVSVWFKLLFGLVIAAAVLYCFFAANRNDRSAATIEPGRLSGESGKFAKADVIIVLVMTIITGCISYIGCGSTSGTPNTYWKPANPGEYVEVAFKGKTDVTRFVFYTGIVRGGTAKVQFYDDAAGTFVDVSASKVTKDDVAFYRWGYKTVSFTTDRVRIVADTAGLWLNEVGFYKTVDGELVPVEIDASSITADYEETADSGRAEYLFDEQKELRDQRSLMDSTYFDEIYFPRTAYEQIHGLSIYERTHPPLGKVFMEIGILIFGMNTFGWRFSGIFFGIMLVPLIYAFALKVFKKSQWAFVAAFLIMFDFMRLAQSRLATIDTYACFFSLAMMYFMYDYFNVKSYEVGFAKSLRPLLFSGIMFGLGAASKWTCIYTGGALAIVFFIAKGRELCDVIRGRAFMFEDMAENPKKAKKTDGGKIEYRNGRAKVTLPYYVLRNMLPTFAVCVVFFIVIPAVIYVLSYVQYMPSNPGKTLIDIVIDNQKYMYNYHSGLTSTHSYSSMWYTWPIMVRPIWYYVGYGVPEGMRSTIASFGNPAIWWIGIPCIFASCVMAWKNKDRRMAYFAVAYALQYAPWILVNRVCFIYHYFSAFAFSIFFIVYFLKELVEKKIIHRVTVIIYLAVVLILFIVYYPVLTGVPVPQSYVDVLKLFSSWSF